MLVRFPGDDGGLLDFTRKPLCVVRAHLGVEPAKLMRKKAVALPGGMACSVGVLPFCNRRCGARP